MRITIIFILLCLAALALTGCKVQSGIHEDYVQGWDSGIIWDHAYTVNDHSTCYCFTDENGISKVLDEARINNQKVVIHYSKYWFGRGFWCSAAENYETVVIDSVEIVKNNMSGV
jgi:hypothetical protein